MIVGAIVLGAVALFFGVRAAVQPEQPLFKWLLPLSLLILLAAALWQSAVLGYVGAAVFGGAAIWDRWWRVNNDASMFF